MKKKGGSVCISRGSLLYARMCRFLACLDFNGAQGRVWAFKLHNGFDLLRGAEILDICMTGLKLRRVL